MTDKSALWVRPLVALGLALLLALHGATGSLAQQPVEEEDPFTYNPSTYAATVSPPGSTFVEVTLGLSGPPPLNSSCFPIVSSGWDFSTLPEGWTGSATGKFSWSSQSATVSSTVTINVPSGATAQSFTLKLKPGNSTPPKGGCNVGAGDGVAFNINIATNAPPSVTAAPDQTVNEGTSQSFTLGSFSDPNGGPWSVTVEWGDSSSATAFTATSAGTLAAQSHTYADGPNSYTVTVTVTDSTGLSDTKTFTVTVNNVAPTAIFAAPASVNDGEAIPLSLSSPFDPSGVDTAAGFTYAFDCGAGYGPFSPNSTASCRGSGGVSRTVGGKIRDKDGGEREYTAVVTIINVPPTVTVTFPAPPDAQAGFFNATQVPVLGSVTATDPSNVTAISCTDSAGGLALGALVGGGTANASRSLSVSGDGTHAISCTATDGVGNSGAAAGSTNTATVKIDTTPPPAPTAPDQDFVVPSALEVVTPLEDSTVRVVLRWSQPSPDAFSGIKEYRLEQSTDGGAFVPVGTTGTTTGEVTLKLGQLLPSGILLHTYEIRVQACDRAGNCSPFASGPMFQLLPLDDSLTNELLLAGEAKSPRINYDGNWKTEPLAGAYNGGVHYATDRGARARLDKVTFFVRGNFAWVSSYRADGGIAEVFVDGVNRGTVNLYRACPAGQPAPCPQPAQVVFQVGDLSPDATHTIVVQLTGTKDPASSGYRVDVDTFMLLR